jgi:hypothetical protein
MRAILPKNLKEICFKAMMQRGNNGGQRVVYVRGVQVVVWWKINVDMVQRAE